MNYLSNTEILYSVNIDFDEAEQAKEKTRNSIGNGMFKYTCKGITKKGHKCKTHLKLWFLLYTPITKIIIFITFHCTILVVYKIYFLSLPLFPYMFFVHPVTYKIY